MTIVVALKVGDGLVMGADSATTMFLRSDHRPEAQYQNSYFNTEKLLHVRDLPVGALTFGLASLNNRSASSLANDLRLKLKSDDSEWHIDPVDFTVESVVERFKRFFYDDRYKEAYEGQEEASPMGFIIGGYSTGSDSAEIWRLTLTGMGAQQERLVAPETPWECVWEGEREAIQRILFGYSNQLLARLMEAEVEESVARQLLASMEPIINGTMPIQDAIDIVEYLIEVTCGYVRFCPGPNVVAKPIDLAAITKHNGFKWVARKHYYPSSLNA